MIRIIVPSFALLSLFILPWPVSGVLVLASALLFPPAGLPLGVLADLVYYVPGAAFLPYFSLFGVAVTGIVLLVHRFVKTRIMEG